MIVHVVSFRWKPGTTPHQIDAIAEGLDRLPATVPSIRSLRHGRDLGVSAPDNADYAIVGVFDDVEGWVAYDSHPAHESVRANLIRPHLQERSAVQFEY
jgi:hypothetical protein